MPGYNRFIWLIMFIWITLQPLRWIARVIEVMLPFFDVKFGNPSSIHSFGRQAEAAVEDGRESVAAGLNCNPDEIIFTSCGTEADNLALRGTALAMRSKTGAERILCSRAEHPAVSKTARQLQSNFGFQVDWLETDEYGMVLPEAVERAISGGHRHCVGNVCQ